MLVLGDVHVKHAYPISKVDIGNAAQIWQRGVGVDAVIVSWSRRPLLPTPETVVRVKGAVEKPVLVGSGVSLSNV